VNRLDQLFARSQREIEAHAVEIAATETGRYYIDEAAHLLAGLRMWAQAQYRSDQAVREILEAGDPTALQQVARELRRMDTRDAKVASWSVEAIAKWPAEQLAAVSSGEQVDDVPCTATARVRELSRAAQRRIRGRIRVRQHLG
jgi:hypothetical protein